jgi:hypothetical protein
VYIIFKIFFGEIMENVIELLKRAFDEKKSLTFKRKPILIGGMAKEYYGIRKTGKDIDLVICEEDYQILIKKYPNNRKDIWGDMGVVIDPFEIWKCIMLLDYNFYIKDAIEEEIVYIVSLEKLMLMCVFGIEVPKYYEDLKLIGRYYRNKYENKKYLEEAETHINSYKKNEGGIIFGGKYIDSN